MTLGLPNSDIGTMIAPLESGGQQIILAPLSRADSQDCWGQPELRLRHATILPYQSITEPSPKWVAADSNYHANHQSKKSQSGLALREAVIVFEDE